MNDMNTIVENIKRGDTNGWSVVYQAYYNKLYIHALSLTNNDPQNAQDAVQGAFSRAMSDNRIQLLKDNGKLYQWLSTFVLNEVRPMWRQQKKYMTFSTTEDYENTFDSIADDDICIPEDYAMDEAFKRRMKKAIESLTSKQRIVIQMYYYDCKTIPQIASAMKLSESSVKTHLTAARAKLKKYIENYEKNGNKFRVIVPIPFLFNKEMPKGIYTAGLKTAGTIMATKVLSGVLAGLIVVNAAVGGVMAVRNNNAIKNKDSDVNKKIASVDNKGDLEVSKQGTDYVDYSDGYYSYTIPKEYSEYIPEPLQGYEVYLNEYIMFNIPKEQGYVIRVSRYSNRFSRYSEKATSFEEIIEDFEEHEKHDPNFDTAKIIDYNNVRVYMRQKYVGHPIDIITDNNILVEVMKNTDSKSTVLEKEDEWLIDFAESINFDESKNAEIEQSFKEYLLESLYKLDYSAPYRKTRVSFRDLIEKYFNDKPNIDISLYAEDSDADCSISFSGNHDGIPLEFEFIGYLKNLDTSRFSFDKRTRNINVGWDWEFPPIPTNAEKITNLSYDSNYTFLLDMYYWYFDDYYYLIPELSPNSVKFDTTPLDKFFNDKGDILDDSIYDRNFEYHTSFIDYYNYTRYLKYMKFKSPSDKCKILANPAALSEIYNDSSFGSWKVNGIKNAIVKIRVPSHDSRASTNNNPDGVFVYDVIRDSEE